MESILTSNFCEKSSTYLGRQELSSWVRSAGCFWFCFLGKTAYFPPRPSGRSFLVTYSSCKQVERTLVGFSSSLSLWECLQVQKIILNLNRYRFLKDMLRIVLTIQFPQKNLVNLWSLYFGMGVTMPKFLRRHFQAWRWVLYLSFPSLVTFSPSSTTFGCDIPETMSFQTVKS